MISASTRRLTGGHFEYRDLGAVALKGWAEPIAAWQVLRMSGVERRFEAQHESKLTPLFGRDEELELLLRRWRLATRGEGRVAVLTGDPGIGKSHIALALQVDLPRFRGVVRTWDQGIWSDGILFSSFEPFFDSAPGRAILPSRPARWCGRRAQRRSRTAPSRGRLEGLSLTAASWIIARCRRSKRS